MEVLLQEGDCFQASEKAAAEEKALGLLQRARISAQAARRDLAKSQQAQAETETCIWAARRELLQYADIVCFRHVLLYTNAHVLFGGNMPTDKQAAVGTQEGSKVCHRQANIRADVLQLTLHEKAAKLTIEACGLEDAAAAHLEDQSRQTKATDEHRMQTHVLEQNMVSVMHAAKDCMLRGLLKEAVEEKAKANGLALQIDQQLAAASTAAQAV
jgi:hypothetical protein